MARRFSYPEIVEMGVGECAHIDDEYSYAGPKVRNYAKRAGRAYKVERSDANGALTYVERLPDPVTDTELPGVG